MAKQERNGVPSRSPGCEKSDVCGKSPPDKNLTDVGGYLVITRPGRLEQVRLALDNTDMVGPDCETTGLDPRAGRAGSPTIPLARGPMGR
jgi:hypothetical protein